MTNTLLWLKIFCLKERGGERPALGDANRKEEVKTFSHSPQSHPIPSHITAQLGLVATVEKSTILVWH